MVRYGKLRCGNVVSNDSDHCEAGHPNKLRDQNRSNSWPYPHSPPRLTVDSPLQDTASPEEPSYEIHDLAASSGAPPNIKPEMSWDDRMRSLPVGSIDINTSEGVKPDCRVSGSKGGITPGEARELAELVRKAALSFRELGPRSWRVQGIQDIVVSIAGTPGDNRLLIGGRRFTSEEACAFADRMEATATQLDDMNARIVRIQEFADSPTDQPKELQRQNLPPPVDRYWRSIGVLARRRVG